MERAFTSSESGPPFNETTDLLRAHIRQLEGKATEIERLLNAFFEGDIDFATFERERSSFAHELLQHGELFDTLGRETSTSERMASLGAGSRSLGTMLLSMAPPDAAAARARQLRAVVVVLRELTQRECDYMRDAGRTSMTMRTSARGSRP